MSNPIAANFVSPALDNIRNNVAQKSGVTPFLLMPLRLETRFMIRKREVPSPDFKVEQLMYALADLNALCNIALAQTTVPNIKAVNDKLLSSQAIAQSITQCAIQERAQLIQLSNDVGINVDSLANKLIPLNRQIATAMYSQMSTLRTSIGGLNVRASNMAATSREMIDEQQRVLSALQNINKGPRHVPYYNIKNKKDLYKYTENLINRARQYYSSAAITTNGLSRIDPEQVKRIQEQHVKVKEELSKALTSISNIHPDPHWKAFTSNRVQPMIAEAQQLALRFEQDTLPKLASLPGLPSMRSGEIFFHGIKMLMKIKTFNEENNQKYDTIKKHKKYLQPLIKTLAARKEMQLEESKPGHTGMVNSLYATIRQELSRSMSKISNYASVNRAQAFGKQAVLSFYEKEALQAVSAYLNAERETAWELAGPTFENVKQLWVRIYPDDIFINTHEKDLTAAEIEAGKQFWKMYWAASGNINIEKSAWKTLCTALGGNRASWVARRLDPRSIPANGVAFDNNAVQQMNTAIAHLVHLRDAIKDYPSLPDPVMMLQQMNSAGFWSLEYHGAEVEKHIRYASTANADKFTALWDSCQSMFSYFDQIVYKTRALTPAQREEVISELSRLGQAAIVVNNIKSRLEKAGVQSFDDYLDEISVPFEFPVVTTKAQDWTKAPHSNVLPERFVVVAMQGNNFSHIVVGNPVPQDLQLGLDPKKFDDDQLFHLDADGNLQVDPGLKWMTDYPTAESVGMGISLDITDAQWDQGFDRLIVLGIRNEDAIASKAQLEELLTNHIYSADGMSILKTGTPTNNTQQGKSGFSPDEEDDQRFNIEIKEQRYNAYETNRYLKADGKHLASLLGVSDSTIQYVNNGLQIERGNAYAMNRSLWNATMGHYMEEMWDGLFNYDNIRRTENFFVNHVTARGAVPSVRIGMQPYGIIATTAFSRLKLYDALPTLSRGELYILGPQVEYPKVQPWGVPDSNLDAKLQQRFEMRLHGILKILHDLFTEIRNNKVIHSGNLQQGDPQQRFMTMLGLHATSLDYFYRYNINIAKGPRTNDNGFETNFLPSDGFGPQKLAAYFREHMRQGIYYPSFEFKDEFLVNYEPYKLADMQYARVNRQLEDSRIFITRQINKSFIAAAPLIDTESLSTEKTLSKLAGLEYDYITWLLGNNAHEIFGNNNFTGAGALPANSMLFMLLRQSLLQTYQEAAMNMLQEQSILDEKFRRGAGGTHLYYNIYETPAIFTKWNYLLDDANTMLNGHILTGAPVASQFFNYLKNNQLTLAKYIHQCIHNGVPAAWANKQQPFMQKINAVRSAMDRLKNIPTADLEMLMAEHADLCTYRLDAWELGLVHRRLEKHRAQQPDGIYLGAYGYVETLKRDSNKTLHDDPSALTPFKLDATKPVFHDPDNQGALHGPSVMHAISAAVLRNAYKSNDASAAVQNRLAVNISSSRVRMALQLIEGIRNGQSLGALLGFRFERGLHERYQTVELDRFIQPFRKAYPLQQKVSESAGEDGATYVSQVVDGAALLKQVQDHVNWNSPSVGTYGNKTLGQILKLLGVNQLPTTILNVVDSNLGPVTPAERTLVLDTIIDEIDRIADAFDALGDLAVSESVYQMVQGNHVRASAVMAALAEGKGIPDPQIIETPRTGHIVTHRMLLNLEAKSSGQYPVGWNNSSSSKASAEPSLNYWLGNILGPAAQYKYILRTKEADGSITDIPRSLETSGWQPIDLFSFPGAEAELNETLINLYKLEIREFDKHISLDTSQRGSDWENSDKSLADLSLLLQHLRSMIGSARYTGANELQDPGIPVSEKDPGAHLYAEFENRIHNAYNAIDQFNHQLSAEDFIKPILNGTTAVAAVEVSAVMFDTITAYLKTALAFGIPQALSLQLAAGTHEQLRNNEALQSLLAVYKQTKEKQEEAAALLSTINGADVYVKDKVEKLSEIAKIIFGRRFIAIPHYTCSGTEIKSQLNLPEDKKITRNGNAMLMDEWMHHLGKVRKRVYDMSRFLQVADVYDLPATSVQPVQLPYNDNDYWMGCEYPDNFIPAGDKLSLLLLNEHLFQHTGSQAGLLIDEWVEVIPAKSETTGVAYHYNQPNATAPQTMMLAVTPDTGSTWKWDDLLYTIIDTVELAKNRAVEPDHIEKSMLSHVLPGIFSEVVPPREKASDPAYGLKPTMDFSNVQTLKK
jgi:hypothetical protein